MLQELLTSVRWYHVLVDIPPWSNMIMDREFQSFNPYSLWSPRPHCYLPIIPSNLSWFHFQRSLIHTLFFQTDSRVEEWPMVKSPLPTLGLCLSYVVFVKVIGPRLMKNREPFNIRWLMITYNLVMVAVSTYIFWMLGIYGWFGKYNYLCQPVDYSNSEDAIGVSIK